MTETDRTPAAPASADGRWLRQPLPPRRDDASRLAVSKIVLPDNPERPATLDEQLDICRTALAQAWRDSGLEADRDRFEQDCRLTLNRARGFGFLAELLPPASYAWSDLTLNPDGSVWARARGGRYFKELHAARTLAVGEVWKDVSNLLAAVGGGAHAQARTISVTDPSLDTKLTARVTGPNGEDWGVRPVCRIKAQHPVIAAGQGYPGVALRFHATEPVTPAHIRGWNMAPDHVLDALLDWTAAGKRIVIGGGTSTGKTTLLSALLEAVPGRERIVKIEDPEEIWCNNPNVHTVEARYVADTSGMNDFTVADGVDDAMRLAPDRLIVGEVRQGRAAMALFRAMMSDHSGMTTFHAESPLGMLYRLGIILRADTELSDDAVPELTEAAVDLYVQIGWAEDADASRSRALLGVYELVNADFIHPEDAAGLIRYKDTPVGFLPLWSLAEADRPLRPLARRQF